MKTRFIRSLIVIGFALCAIFCVMLVSAVASEVIEPTSIWWKVIIGLNLFVILASSVIVGVYLSDRDSVLSKDELEAKKKSLSYTIDLYEKAREELYKMHLTYTHNKMKKKWKE